MNRETCIWGFVLAGRVVVLLAGGALMFMAPSVWSAGLGGVLFALAGVCLIGGR